MAKSKLVWIVGGLGLLLFVGAVSAAVVGGVYWTVGEGGDGGGYQSTPTFVALGGGAALMIESGIDSFTVRRVDVEGNGLAESWRWQAPAGLGAHPWNWWRAGDHVVGEFHALQGGSSERTLFVFHVDDGQVGQLDHVRGGVWTLEPGALFAQTTDAVVELELSATVEERWRVPLTGSEFMGRPSLGQSHAYLYDGILRVFSRQDGSSIAEVEGDLAGVDRVRGEALLRTGAGRVHVVNVLSGETRIELDLAGGPAVVDGMEDPALLGTHGGRWLITYATELDHTTTTGNAGWTRHAPVWLASVDPASGTVAWRAQLGPMRRVAGRAGRYPLGDERELPNPLLIYGDDDVEGGGAVTGHMLSVSLGDGAVLWRTRFDGANRSNTLFARREATTWFRLPDPNDLGRSALVRFEAGRFTSAVFLVGYETIRAPALETSEGWIPGADADWHLVRGAEMAIAAGSPNGAPPADAREWALGRLGLPDAAR